MTPPKTQEKLLNKILLAIKDKGEYSCGWCDECLKIEKSIKRVLARELGGKNE